MANKALHLIPTRADVSMELISAPAFSHNKAAHVHFVSFDLGLRWIALKRAIVLRCR